MPFGSLLWTVLVWWGLVLAGTSAMAQDGDLCAAAIRRVEQMQRLPSGLLDAVSRTESGRRDPERGRAVSWPWTVNNAGDGRYFTTKAEAIAHVEALRRAGRRNIDVGCMQINLMYHPDAFADLEEAFEPLSNVGYGADFLTRLRRETGSWDQAVARYHTADVERGQAYREKVFDRWQDVRLAEALPPSLRRGAEPAAGPSLFRQRSARGPATKQGYLALSQVPARVAVLRPSGMRPVRGEIRPDGTIVGSRLRIGAQRRSAGTAAPSPPEPAAGILSGDGVASQVPAGHKSLVPATSSSGSRRLPTVLRPLRPRAGAIGAG